MIVKLLINIFLTLCLLNVGILHCAAGDNFNDENVIMQYFSYINIINRIKMDNMLDMSRNFVTQLLDSIPYDDRRNSAEMLQNFMNNVERAKGSESFSEKESVLLELQQLIGSIEGELVKQEREDIIIRNGLIGTFELLARMSIEDRKFHEKFINATKLLRDKVSAEGEERYAMLFNLVNSIENEQDIVQREALVKRYNNLKDQLYNEITLKRHMGMRT